MAEKILTKPDPQLGDISSHRDHFRRSPRFIFSFVATLAVQSPTSIAHAAGIELGSVGVQSVGRAGTFAARASDPTALWHNVAGIVGLPGVQFTVSSNVGLWQHCFAREGRYDGTESGVVTNTTVFMDSRYPTARPSYPEVCNSVSPAIVPQLLITYRIRPWLAIGGGLLTPAGVGSQQFPDRVATTAGAAPAPTRYQVLSTNALIINPTIAVAVAPTSWLRIGAALQPSIARFAGETTANAIGSQSPATDIRTAADAWGFFFAGNLGVQVQPTPSLTFGFHTHINPSPVRLEGKTTAVVRPYAINPAERISSKFDSVVFLPLPSIFRIGARYASLRADANPQWSDRDPMRDEVFDVEINAHFENSSVFQTVTTLSSGNVQVGPGQFAPATPEAILRRSWRDTFGVRAGGDYNLIRNVLALRAGLSWDLGAQTGARTYNGAVVEYNPDAGIDTGAYDTVGVSMGASYRWKSLTFDVAYQHVFTFGQVVEQGRAQVVSGTVMITPEDCARGAGYPGPGACTNNQGTYSASLDLLAFGVTGRL